VLLKILNKKTINIIYKWTLRFYYARLLILGITSLCFCLVLFFTDYKVTDKKDFNTFIMVISGLLGLIFLLVGFYSQAQTEYGIRNNWHKKDIE